MSDRVRIDITDGVADVRLNRPEKLNALDGPMIQAITEAAISLADDRSLRAVVLSGEGRAFCAGLDFSSFQGMASGGSGGADSGAGGLLARSEGSIANRAQRPAWAWQEVPVPVIAAVHGVAYGGGIQIALGADIRLVAPDARLSVREIQWGLVPDMSGPQTLRHLVPLDVAKELTFTGREVSGTEAVRLGLATRVSESPREEALALAREIATRSPDAIRAGKKLLNEVPNLEPAEGLRLEAKLQASIIMKPNQVEAVKANLEKRAPKFDDPE